MRQERLAEAEGEGGRNHLRRMMRRTQQIQASSTLQPAIAPGCAHVAGFQATHAQRQHNERQAARARAADTAKQWHMRSEFSRVSLTAVACSLAT